MPAYVFKNTDWYTYKAQAHYNFDREYYMENPSRVIFILSALIQLSRQFCLKVFLLFWFFRLLLLLYVLLLLHFPVCTFIGACGYFKPKYIQHFVQNNIYLCINITSLGMIFKFMNVFMDCKCMYSFERIYYFKI